MAANVENLGTLERRVSMSVPVRDIEKKGGALKRLLVVATGEVFTASIRDQERPGIE